MHIHYKGFERKIGHYIPIEIDISINLSSNHEIELYNMTRSFK
jgi:hypothetical protein